MVAPTKPRNSIDPELLAAAKEVDRSLLRWFRSLSMRERLRGCAKTSAALKKFKRVPSKAG